MSPTQTWVAAVCTLACYSYLYKENFFFRLAEHTFIPVAVAHVLVTYYHTTFITYKNTYMVKQGWWWMWFFVFAGALFYTRFLPPKWSWLARYPIAMRVGWELGAYFSVSPRPYIVQMVDAIKALSEFENILFFLCFATAMMYFFFTVASKSKVVTIAAKWGRWILMIGFGASFGNTINGRISLFLGRVQFLLSEWLKIKL
ncbi:MAG: hypothetical protein ACM3WU_11770 [Bacillota bacterium]